MRTPQLAIRFVRVLAAPLLLAGKAGGVAGTGGTRTRDLRRTAAMVTAVALAALCPAWLSGASAAAARTQAPAAARAAASRGALLGVAAASNSSAWAVGYAGSISSPKVLMLHWNGTAWSQVTRPAPIAGALNAVTATTTSGWAVGDVHPGGAAFSPLILRLAGKAWSRPATKYGTHADDDVVLSGVAVTSAKSAWAIGNTQATSALAHWNGSTWK